jgi:hypothetical protein
MGPNECPIIYLGEKRVGRFFTRRASKKEDSMRKKVEKTLFGLWAGELFAVVCFALLWLIYAQQFKWAKPYVTSWPSVYAFALLEFIFSSRKLLLVCKMETSAARLFLPFA